MLCAVTRSKIRVSCLRFCCRAGFLSWNVISARVVDKRVSGCSQFDEICEIAVLNAVSEEFWSACFALDETFCDHWWVATREMSVLKSFSSFEMSQMSQTASSSSHFWASKEMKYEYFRSFSFAVKVNQEIWNIWKRFSHRNHVSRRRFALSVTTGVFATALAWTDCTAVIPVS